MRRFLHVTPTEFVALRQAIDELPHGTDAVEALPLVGIPLPPDGFRYSEVEVVVRHDCAFLPVKWRRVERWATEGDVAQELPRKGER